MVTPALLHWPLSMGTGREWPVPATEHGKEIILCGQIAAFLPWVPRVQDSGAQFDLVGH